MSAKVPLHLIEGANNDGEVLVWDSNNNVWVPSNAFDPLVFPDKDGDGDQWEINEDGNDGHLHISHPSLPGSIIFRQDGTIETDGFTGDPGADDRLVPRGYVDSQSNSTGTSSGDLNVERLGTIIDLGGKVAVNTTISLSEAYEIGIPTIQSNGSNNFGEEVELTGYSTNGNGNIDGFSLATDQDANSSYDVTAQWMGVIA